MAANLSKLSGIVGGCGSESVNVWIMVVRLWLAGGWMNSGETGCQRN